MVTDRLATVIASENLGAVQLTAKAYSGQEPALEAVFCLIAESRASS